MTDTWQRSPLPAQATTIGALLKFAWRNALVQVGWPLGPALLVSAVGLAFLMGSVTPTFGLTEAVSLRAASVIVLAASVLWLVLFFWNVLVAGYEIQKKRAELAEAELRSVMLSAVRFDPEQLKRALAHYYGSAHTFLYFDMASNVSLSQNVRSIKVHSPYELTIHFLQALDPPTILVRPLGGTPKLEITSMDSRSLRIRLCHTCTFVRLRIFGDIIPAIRNHGPNSAANEMVIEHARASRDRSGQTGAS